MCALNWHNLGSFVTALVWERDGNCYVRSWRDKYISRNSFNNMGV